MQLLCNVSYAGRAKCRKCRRLIYARVSPMSSSSLSGGSVAIACICSLSFLKVCLPTALCVYSRTICNPIICCTLGSGCDPKPMAYVHEWQECVPRILVDSMLQDVLLGHSHLFSCAFTMQCTLRLSLLTAAFQLFPVSRRSGLPPVCMLPKQTGKLENCMLNGPWFFFAPWNMHHALHTHSGLGDSDQ